MEDWNSVVVGGKEENIVGKYGLGKQNERGDRLVEFSVKHKLAVTNTLF